MTHTIQSNNKTWCFVEVPEEAVFTQWDSSNFFIKNKTGLTGTVRLPPGQWSIHSDSAAMTESLSAEVVTNEGTKTRPIYTDYSDPFRSMFLSVASLDTLAASLGITGRYIILQSI